MTTRSTMKQALQSNAYSLLDKNCIFSIFASYKQVGLLYFKCHNIYIRGVYGERWIYFVSYV